MLGLSALDWSLLAVATLLVGFAKTAIGGVAMVSIALFATVLPARESTGALLPLLIVGDVVAVRLYRRHADWARLVRLLPSVAVGMVVGVGFLAVADDIVMRRTIGAVLLALVGAHLWQQRARSPSVRPDRAGSPATAAFGWLAGFTTMVANAGGTAMSLYLLRSRVGVLGFLGTGAWFFLVVNVAKVPFSVGLGLITPVSLAMGAVLVPALLAGAAAGRWCISRIDQARFEQVVLVFTVLGALNLVR